MMADVLIIEDDEQTARMLRRILENNGHGATCTFTLSDGLDQALRRPYDVVLLDVWLPDGNGLAVLPQIRRAGSSPEVIMITGAGDPDGAESAVRNGAWAYLQKPLLPSHVLPVLHSVLQHRNNVRGNQEPALALKLDGIVGTSPQIKPCIASLGRAANSETGVLITGETGTGKELFARAIHSNSQRAEKPFVVVDCAALPETLIETSLFGYEKGAFTGADRTREGLVRQADGGTLFLDEVGELPLSVQGSFLRVLQEHRFRPVGGKEETQSDFRLISATNRDLDKMAEAGKFRIDLLFRLKAAVIDVPPLRKRGSDIKEIAMYYLRQYSDRCGTGTKGFSPDFFEALDAYHWPGNVRELVHAMEAALSAMGSEPTLFPLHLPREIRIELARTSVQRGNTGRTFSTRDHLLKEDLPAHREWLARMEKKYLHALLASTQGNMEEACRISGLPRSTLYHRLKKHGVTIRP